MAIGRISGPLLKRNLIRDGVELTVRNTQSDPDILYIDVVNGRIGVNTTSPAFPLDVDGTIQGTGLRSDIADVGNINLSGTTIKSNLGDINIQPGTVFDKVIIGPAEIPNIYGNVTVDGDIFADNFTAGSATVGRFLTIGEIVIDGDLVTLTTDNSKSLVIEPNGTGILEIRSDTEISENLQVLGNALISGNLTVQGTTAVIGSENITIKDNIIVLNSEETNSGVSLRYSGVKVNRGSSDNVAFLWDETQQTWGLYQGSEDPAVGFSVDSDTSNLKLSSLSVDSQFKATVDAGTYPVNDPDTNLAKLQIKRSLILGEKPQLSDIDVGEIAANIVDGKLFLKRQYIKFGEQVEEISEFVSSVPIKNTIFVQKNGLDTNSGESWDRAVLTVERALELAELRNGETTLIDIAPGVYYTRGELAVPDNTLIRSVHRAAVFRPEPGYAVSNVFLLGSGCFIEGPVFEDWQIDDMENPSKGFAVAFRPGAVIRRVPYAHKIVVRNTPTWTSIAPPLDRNSNPPNPYIPPAGGVVLADGSVCSPYSIYPNIMTWGATPVLHNGIGYCAKNGGLINAVNAVSLWCHKHFYALNGGQIVLSSCSTQFGDYTMVSKGTRSILQVNDIPLTFAGAMGIFDIVVDNNSEQIIDSMWNYLVDQSFTTGWTAEDQLYTRKDALSFLKALSWTLESTNQKPVQDFIKGLYDTVGNPVFAQDKLPAFVASFEFLRDQVKLLVNASLDTIVDQLAALVIDTITSPEFTSEPSLITTIGHTWTAVMAGVALTKIPPAFNKTTIQESILELDRGVVIASGQDDQGSAMFVGGLEINADTGELTGPPFISAVNRIATRAAIARSF